MIFWNIILGNYCNGKLVFRLIKVDNFGNLKGLTTIFAGQENPFIIFRSKEIYIYFKTNIKIPINLLK